MMENQIFWSSLLTTFLETVMGKSQKQQRGRAFINLDFSWEMVVAKTDRRAGE